MNGSVAAYNGSLLYENPHDPPVKPHPRDSSVRGASSHTRDVPQPGDVSGSDPPWDLYLCVTERDTEGDMGMCLTGGPLNLTHTHQKVNNNNNNNNIKIYIALSFQ